MKGASLVQVRAGRGGRMIEVDQDVLDIAKRLHEIDRSLGLDWNDAGEYFRVYQLVEGGEKHTITTSTDLTPELIERVRQVMHPDYDVAAELDRMDREAQRERDHQFAEQTGEAAERLHSALKRDLGLKPRIVVPSNAKLD